MELRKHPRFPAYCPINFQGEDIVGEGAVVNVSLGGCEVESRVPVQPKTYLGLRIAVSTATAPLEVEVAPVRWSDGHKFGIEFMCMQADAQELLRQFVETLEAQSEGTEGSPGIDRKGSASVERRSGRDRRSPVGRQAWDEDTCQTMKRILVIDDDPQVLQTLSMMMKRLGHLAFVALDGQHALKVFKQDAPHAAILDLNLPDMNGIEVLRQIRAYDEQFPVIILTGAGTETLEQEGKQLGISDFLVKGFSLQALKHALDRALVQPVTTTR